MLPLGDENHSRRTTPVVTIALIVANVLVYLLEMAGGDAFIIRWSFIPQRFTYDPISGFITIFSAMFMHGGLLHILGNMLYLWIFGDNIEDRFGHFWYLVFYLACGVLATFAQYAVNPSSAVPNLGASGAIAGVLGAYLLLFPKGRVRVLIFRIITVVPAWMALGIWIVLQMLSGFGSLGSSADIGGIAYMAHIGGFFSGVGLGLILRIFIRQRASGW